MDKAIHRIRKKFFVSMTAVFLSVLAVVPSFPAMRNPGLRSVVVEVSSMNNRGVEEDVDPDEGCGREEKSRSVSNLLPSSAEYCLNIVSRHGIFLVP